MDGRVRIGYTVHGQGVDSQDFTQVETRILNENKSAMMFGKAEVSLLPPRLDKMNL